MTSLVILGMKMLTQLFKLLPSLEWADKIPVVDGIQTVSNIFAWACYFLPVPLMLTLLTLTMSFYAFKIFLRIIFAVRQFVK